MKIGKNAAMIFVSLVLALPFTGSAQEAKTNGKRDNKLDKDIEQIIITRSNTDSKKLNIEVDGNKILVNGKDVTNGNDDDVKVTRRKIKDLKVFNENAGIVRPGMQNLRIESFRSPNKALLGIATQQTDNGTEIMEVTEESAASEAGLQKGDVILKIDDKKIESPDDVSSYIRGKNPGDKITIQYKRDDKTNTASAILKKNDQSLNSLQSGPMELNIEDLLGKIPNYYNQRGTQSPGSRNYRQFFNFDMPSSATPKLGIKVQDVEDGTGVKILSIEKNSDAEKAGLKTGDIIRKLNDSPVTGTDNALAIIRGNRKAAIKCEIERNGRTQTITIIQAKKLKTSDL